jgi:DNA-binding IclR family transcriptional regulator
VLAGLLAAEVRALFPDAGAFAERHGTGPRSLSALRRLLTEVGRQGYASEDGEVTPGFSSVAAAVHDHTGRPIAGLAVTFPTEQLDMAARPWLAQQVTKATRELTRRIGGHT